MPDVIVVGGGVMGLAAARELRRRGQSVSLLERATPGRAASWASAGIIGATTRDENDPGYELRHLSRQLWPDFATQLEEESGLDPEYRENGCLYLASDERERRWLQSVAARDSAAEFLDQRALHEAEPAIGPAVQGALRVSGGNVDPRRLCRALEIAVRRMGVEVRTATPVDAVLSQGGRVSGVQVGDEQIDSNVVVLAAGAWSAQIAGVDLNVPVHPQKGQIFALDQTRVGIRHVLLTAGDPYFVPRCDGRLVIGATREETGWDASLTAGGIAWLLNRAMLVVPGLSDCAIAEMWTGFRPLSADGVPLIGGSETEGLYVLTGHGPSGISPMPGTIALLIALMHGERPPISPGPFDPLRFAVSAPSAG
ncbi:MAG: glycine oxidase ThiO [Chloroflexi bacterium]|nr:glycine oxidase ThiO [Chloroflexota bacterium]